MKKITNLLMFASLALFSWQGYAQTGSDDCANAVVVTPGTYTDAIIIADSAGASQADAGDAIWYSYTPAGDGTIDIGSCASDPGGVDTRLWIYTDGCATLTNVAGDDDGCGAPNNFGSIITEFDVTGGVEYLIEWDDRWEDSNSFDWTLSFTPAPVNAPDCAINLSPADATTGVGSSVILTWEAPTTGDPNLDSYDVFFGTDMAALTLNSNVTGLTETIGSLTPGTEYFWQIVPKNAIGDATGCVINSFMTSAVPPNCAINLMPADGTTNVPSAGLLDLTWEAPLTGPVPDSYDVFFGTDMAALTLQENVTGLTAQLTGLVEGTTYFYQIVPKNASGDATGCAINSFAIEIPAGAECDTAIAISEGIVSDTSVIVGSGSASQADATDAIWYSYTATGDGTIAVNSCSSDPDNVDTRLWIWTDGCATLTAVAADDDGCDAPNGFGSIVSDVPVLNGVEYLIEWDDRWEAASFDFELTFTPAPTCANPDDTAIDVDVTTADATWTASLGAVSYDWEVVPSGNAQGTGVVAFENGNTSLMAAITGLTEATAYDFYIKADCFATYEGPISFTTNASCAPPEMLAATVTGTDTATISWSGVNTPASDVFDYEVVNITAGGVATGTPTGSTSGGANSADLTAPLLIEDNEYQFLVRAVCPAGLGTTVSDWSPAVNWFQTVAPGCASNPTPLDGAIDIPIGNVTFTWDAPTTAAAAAEYDVYGGNTAALEFGVITTVTATTVDLSINAFDTTLFWSIVPKNAGGEATGCPVWSFTTESADAGGVDCVDAVAVVDGSYSSQIDDATAGANNGDDLWYVYTATTGGSLDINSCNSGNRDTRLAIYDECGDFIAFGDAGNNPIAISDDNCGLSSQVIFDVVAGEDYFIQWDDRWNVDTFVWDIIFTPSCLGITTTWDGTTWDNGAPGTDDYAIIAGVYSTSDDGNLDVCSLQVDGTLTVDAGGFAKAEGDINVTVDGTLNVAHTGSVVQVDDAATMTNDGAMSVLVDLPTVAARDFLLIGSPTDAADRADFAGFRMLAHDTNAFELYTDMPVTGVNFNDADLNDWSAHTGILTGAEGYFYVPGPDILTGGDYTLDYTTGNLNNGEFSYPTIFDTDKQESPNVLSNPYPSAIDTDALIGSNLAIDEVYFWEHNTTPSPMWPGASGANFNMEDISVRNVGMGVAASTGGTAPTQFMSSGQGFGIKAATGDAVVFNNALRVTGNNDDLRTSTADRLWLSVTNSEFNLASNMGVLFTNDATAGYEAKYDSKRLATPVLLYSTIEGSEDGFIIQGREAFTSGATVGVGFSTLVEQDDVSYTVSMTNRDGDNMLAANVYLIDNVLNTVTDLTNEAYTFTASYGDDATRFTVVFENDALGTNDVSFDGIAIYPNPAKNVLNVASPNAQISSIEITDLRGRVVFNQAVNAQNASNIDVSNLDSAVYLVTVKTVEGSITKKFVKE